eukprot:15468963-Alexandrium_andersonii.AAC.2
MALTPTLEIPDSWQDHQPEDFDTPWFPKNASEAAYVDPIDLTINEIDGHGDHSSGEPGIGREPEHSLEEPDREPVHEEPEHSHDRIIVEEEPERSDHVHLEEPAHAEHREPEHREPD